MARFDLTDFEWSVIQPLLPNKPRGVPRVDDRRVLNGIFWRYGPARRGPTSRSATARTRRASIASTGGAEPGCGIGFWRRCQTLMTATCRSSRRHQGRASATLPAF